MARTELSSLLERRATTTVLVLAATLSLLRLAGVLELDELIARNPGWRERPWQLWTTTLLHADALHLAFDVFWLAVLGARVERVLGTARAALLLALLAAVSSAAELALARGVIGLSGVDYGLVGYLLVVQRRDPRFRGALSRDVVLLFVAWGCLCIGLTLGGVTAVANVAHGAGALAGALAGWTASRARSAGIARALPAAALLAALALAPSAARPYLRREAYAREQAELGRAALDEGDPARAVPRLERALRADPDDADGWWNLGAALWALGRRAEARAALERSAELAPPEGEQRRFLVQLETSLSDAARDEGRDDDAELLLARALALAPDDAAALGRLGFLRERAGERSLAIELYKRASSAGRAEPWVGERLRALAPSAAPAAR